MEPCDVYVMINLLTKNRDLSVNYMKQNFVEKGKLFRALHTTKNEPLFAYKGLK